MGRRIWAKSLLSQIITFKVKVLEFYGRCNNNDTASKNKYENR